MPAAERRAYHSLRSFYSDLRVLTAHWRAVLEILRGKGPASDFRERLMLTVTAVNQCRYCAALHTHLARRAGISADEIDELLRSDLPPGAVEQHPALFYARCWAEADGRPAADEWLALISHYGQAQARRIEAVLWLIRIGNLTGNTFDKLRRRVRGGG